MEDGTKYMEQSLVINGIKYYAEKPTQQTPYVLVRSKDAGVFAGNLIENSDNGVKVVLNNCRRIWYWSGASSLSQMALEGVKNPKDCKFSMTTQNHTIYGVCEIIQTSAEAEKLIIGTPVWKN